MTHLLPPSPRYAWAKTTKTFGSPSDLPSNRYTSSYGYAYKSYTTTAVADEFNANEVR